MALRVAARLLLGVTISSSASVAAHATEDEALALAARFCDLQYAAEDERVLPLLTRPFAAILVEARERNSVLEENATGSTPLGAGIPWRTFSEVNETCKPGDVRISANMVMVTVRYDVSGEANSGWKDTLVMKQEDGRLAIDDVLYQLFPTDTYRGGLRRFIADSFD